MLPVTSSHMSSCLADIAQLALWTFNFVDYVTFEHVRGLLRKHFDNCQITPSVDLVSILGRAKGEKLLTLEALFIAEIKPKLNTKDEYRSRELKLKF